MIESSNRPNNISLILPKPEHVTISLYAPPPKKKTFRKQRKQKLKLLVWTTKMISKKELIDTAEGSGNLKENVISSS